MINGIVHRSNFRNTCPEVTLATKNPTCTALRSKLDLCIETEGELSILSRILNTCIRVNEWAATRPVSKLYTRISHIQNDTDKKSGALRTSNPCQSREKLSKFRCRWLGECRCAPLLLDVTRLADGYTHNKRVGVPFGWRRKRLYSCAKCISVAI